MPYFSVIIPTFNRRDILKETILSLSSQTFTDFELIIADDGSSDGTEKMVAELKTSFPVRYQWHKNAGRSAARNMGLKMARGKVVVFIDDHVYSDSRLLEEHYNFHQKYGATKIKVIRGFAPLVRDKSEIPAQAAYQDMSTFKFKGENNPFISFFTGNVSIDKEALEKVGGFEEDFKEYGFQDSELGYRLVKAGYHIKVNPNAIVYVFSAKLSFEKRCDKSRQAGHSAVVLLKKHFFLGIYVGINPFNLFMFMLFSLNNRYFLHKLYYNKLDLLENGSKEHEKVQSRIRYYYFLFGIYEKLFKTKSLQEYYAQKNPGSPLS
ncbi:MAG: hypothetical protein A2X41_06620 [Candidatus Margulisbacteria bacterium GWE2_39_32]|nr:MAG: hypothetical protein A2X41_06620 [Candidatus Margulisbacteria bacterium GWE2_39_32]